MIGSGTLSIDGSAATGSNALTVDASSAAFTSTPHLSIIGGAGNDTFKFHSTDFSSNDTITDSSGSNTIQITDAATVSDAAFANVTGVQTVKLGNFTNSVTVGTSASANVGGVGKTFTIDDSVATNTALTVNGSAMTANLVVIYGATSATTDSLTGGTGSDTFEIHNAAFTSSMTINGTSGADTIQLLDPATIADTAFTHVSNVQMLKLGNFANSVTLAAVANTMSGSGTLSIDGSAATGSNALTVDASSAAFTSTPHLSIIGGAGNDTFKFHSTDFSSNDTITDSSGSNTIQITDAATVSDAAFANVTGVQTVKLGNFTNSVTLATNANTMIGSATLSIDGSAATGSNALTVDASSAAFTSTPHLSIIGGAGNDTFKFHSTDFSSNDTITDSSGSNTIQITDAATVSDAAFANVTGVQTVKLGNFTNSVTLATNANTMIGSGTLTVDASAATTTGNKLTIDATLLGTTAHLALTGGTGGTA